MRWKMVFKFLNDIQKTCEMVHSVYENMVLYKIKANSEGKIYSTFGDSIKYINDILKEMNIKEIEIDDKKEIRNLYNSIIMKVFNKLDAMMKKINRKELLLALYEWAAYMIKLHDYMELARINKLKKEKIESSNFLNEIEKEILTKVNENNKTNSWIFDSFKGVDKNIIQVLFFVYSQLDDNKNVHEKLNVEDIFTMNNLATVIIELTSERDFILSKFISKATVKVSNYEIEHINNNFQDNPIQKIYLDLIREEDEENDEDYVISKLERNLFTEYGFKLKTIEEVFVSNNTSSVLENKVSDIIIIEHKKLVELIRSDGKCSKEEAESIIKYFVLKFSDKTNIYNACTKYPSRIVEQPLVEYNDNHYLFSYYLFRYSIRIFRNKLKYNLLSDAIKKENSEVVEKGYKIKFEKQVYNLIKNYMDKAIWNFQDFIVPHNSKNRKVHLLYEIDILAIKNRTLYILECKDIVSKFNSKGIEEDIKKGIKFINRLIDKENEVEKYKDELGIFMGSKYDNIEKILIFKNYNAIANAEIDAKKVKILCSGDLKEWLEGL
jgi:hypothetical protein